MRYSKILLAIVLISMLVFGSTLSGFAVVVGTFHVTTSVLEGVGTVTDGGDYAYDAPVSVTATPGEGYKFVKWIITCEGGVNESTLSTYNFTMHQHDVKLEACFAEKEVELIYKLTAFAADPSMGTVTGSGDYGYTQFVDVKAIPNPGYKFVGWEVCFNGAGMNPLDKPASFTCNLSLVNEYVPNVYLRATFELLPADASVKVHYLDENLDFMIPEVIITGVIGMPYVTEAKVFPGYELIAMPDNATGTYGEVQGHVDYLYRPAELPSDFTVTVTVSPLGSGTITGAGVHTAGHVVTLTANDATGYNFSNWVFNAAVITPTINGDVMTFTMPDENVAVTANFIVATTTEPTTEPATQPATQQTSITIVPTTQTITVEPVPLAAPTPFDVDQFLESDMDGGPFNIDGFLEDTPNPEVNMDEELLDEEVPLADGLPATGQFSVDYFYGIGGLISGLGLWLKRRK